MNLSSIDLNLLHVLSVVLEERSATRAAKRLHVTQSAVSNALARLREVLKDPLFVRQGRGLVPTPVAVELQPRLAGALRDLAALVEPERTFDPSTCSRELSLACADNQQLSDLPLLCKTLAREMPRARLRVVSVDTLLATDGLATGEVDVAISPEGAHPGLPFAPLYVETPVAILRRDHAYRGKVLSKKAFSEIPQVGLNIALGRPGFARKVTDRAFQEGGLDVKPLVSVPSFAAAGMVVAATDFLACVPRRVAYVLAKHLPLRVVELPVQTFSLQMGVVWHHRTDADPALRHFRALMVRCLQRAPGAKA